MMWLLTNQKPPRIAFVAGCPLRTSVLIKASLLKCIYDCVYGCVSPHAGGPAAAAARSAVDDRSTRNSSSGIGMNMCVKEEGTLPTMRSNVRNSGSPPASRCRRRGRETRRREGEKGETLTTMEAHTRAERQSQHRANPKAATDIL